MKRLEGLLTLCSGVVMLLSGVASAQDVVTYRCTTDSLDPQQAELRLKWARRCALQVNIVSPSRGWDTQEESNNNAGNLIEYIEDSNATNPSGTNRYAPHSSDFEINGSYVGNLYRTPTAINQFTETYPQGTFKVWEGTTSRKRPRPLYPSFGNTPRLSDTGNVLIYPHPTLQTCDLYSDPNGINRVSTFYINVYCEASCYTPEQRVLFSDGEEAIVDAFNKRRTDLVTLDPNSTLDNIHLRDGKLRNYTVEARDAEHPIIELVTASGGSLRVTTEHPVLDGEGRLVQAQDLKVGHELVKADGTRDTIVEVRQAKHYGKVYNLRPETSDLVSNLLVAQGYVVGSSTFQNDDVGYINSILLHRVPENLIP